LRDKASQYGADSTTIEQFISDVSGEGAGAGGGTGVGEGEGSGPGGNDSSSQQYGQQGMAVARGGPGELSDIDYLFDIGGDTIFIPPAGYADEDKTDFNRPYVYAKRGGMIRNTDLVEAAVRLLQRKR
jgi:hypothetical protein